MDAARIIKAIEHRYGFDRQLHHIEILPARDPVYADLGDPLPGAVESVLRLNGVERLYQHQVEAIEAVRLGENVVVVTGTASGKSLCYQLPIYERLVNEPFTSALLLYPTKALAQDQLRTFVKNGHAARELDYIVGAYDGDTSASMRRKLRDKASLILTNPDMLHAGILPFQKKWQTFFLALKYVVIDELHTYRGIFGSHFANVIKRLLRVCRDNGSNPQFICCSATVANPKELAEVLTSQPFRLIDKDGAPAGPKRFVLWNPAVINDETMERRSALGDAQRIMTDLIKEGIPTITFTQTRTSAELIYRETADLLQRESPSLARKIAPYRGGYLPEERREIERKLFNGELLGVVSTSALELGIDIGGLDASVIVGYPGSISSVWQRAGRAGRGREESVVFFIARNNPLDQFLVKNPEYFFGRSPEHGITDPTNPHIVVSHLRCAADELALRNEEILQFGDHAPHLIRILDETLQLRKGSGGWYYIGNRLPSHNVNLRTLSDVTYNIVEESTGEVIGSMDEISAFSMLHDHAVYLHGGRTYHVTRLDIDKHSALVGSAGENYYTQSVGETRLRVDETEDETTWRSNGSGVGMVTVTFTILMFKKIKFGTHENLGFENLQLPERHLETVATWVTPCSASLKRVSSHGRAANAAMLALSNVVSHVAPLFLMTDPGDIGTALDSGNFGRAALFVYDKYHGGIGFSQKLSSLWEEVLDTATNLIHDCECETGCPSCIGSPLAGTGVGAWNDWKEVIPDKEGALVLLHAMLGREPYVPRFPIPSTDVVTEPEREGAVPVDSHRVRDDTPMPAGVDLPVTVEQRIRRQVARQCGRAAKRA